jgi:ureidoglycolate dehydrogenase (NAD+)
MATISYHSVRIRPSDLLALTAGVLAAMGVPPADARYVAWHLVETNLRGTDSHGVARLPHYVRRLKAGGILSRPQMMFQRQGAAVGTLDGGHGLGHLVMARAADEAAHLARESGAGWVAVKNSSHCGALAPLGLRLAEQGLIGFVFSHVDPMVLPHGSSRGFAGTNPICITAPGADGKTLCLDIATSIVPWNLVANAQKEGVPIPSGWAVDRQGEPTTNPNEVAALHPFGFHKGSGLGLLIDVLCAMLSGAPFGPQIPKMYSPDLSEHRQLGGLVGAIDIARFIKRSSFEARVLAFVTQLGALPAAQGFDRVRFPGEPELETKRQREQHGIPVGRETLDELNSVAEQVGVPRVQPLETTHSDVH